MRRPSKFQSRLILGIVVLPIAASCALGLAPLPKFLDAVSKTMVSEVRIAMVERQRRADGGMAECPSEDEPAEEEISTATWPSVWALPPANVSVRIIIHPVEANDGELRPPLDPATGPSGNKSPPVC